MPTKAKTTTIPSSVSEAVKRHSLLRVIDVVARLGVSARTVWSLTKGGQLHHVRIGKAVRYRAEDVESFIIANAS